MNYFTLILALLFGLNTYSQTESKSEDRFQWSFEGQFVAATDGRGMYTNFGGPGLKWNFKYFSIGFNMMPSLRFENQPKTPLVTPILGTGPQLYLLKNRRLIISVPMYYIASRQMWTFTGGIGYVITTKKK